MTLDAPVDIDRLRAAIAAAGPEARILSVELDGATYWVKRVERLSLRWRLQKGDAAQALERERQAYHALGQRGLPIAELVDEGADYLVIRDGGQAVTDLVEVAGPELRAEVLCAGAEALHRLHAVDVTHGRPHPRDMLWDGQAVTFIDFERFGTVRNLARAKAIDLILFAFGCFDAANGRDWPEVFAALATYRALDRDGVWQDATRLLRRLRWLRPVVLSLPGVRDGRDVRAGAQVFAAFLDDDPRLSLAP